MKRILCGLLCVAVAVIGFGCSRDDTVRPDLLPSDGASGQVGPDKVGHFPPVAGEYYAMFWTDDVFNYADFSRISRKDGEADFFWRLQAPTAGDGENSFGWIAFGFAFDLDGSMYMTLNICAFDPTAVRTQFARVDNQTGAVTPYGPIMDFNTSGGDIDACGNFFVCGFQVDALGYIWGNDSLWRVDKATGEFTEVGPTGHTNWMDLAFDNGGTLWGTFDNQLYVIDTQTGASTLVADIQDVPDAGPPHFMEVMSIAFDSHNVLYGTGLTVHYDDPRGSPVMRIDPATGETELLGYSHTQYANHGGDIMPSTVRIAHNLGNGRFKCQTISMAALPVHLAHGDYVPGTVGHDCDCP